MRGRLRPFMMGSSTLDDSDYGNPSTKSCTIYASCAKTFTLTAYQVANSSSTLVYRTGF